VNDLLIRHAGVKPIGGEVFRQQQEEEEDLELFSKKQLEMLGTLIHSFIDLIL